MPLLVLVLVSLMYFELYVFVDSSVQHFIGVSGFHQRKLNSPTQPTVEEPTC